MRLSAFKELTRFEQTLFALPFVLGGAVLSLAEAPLSRSWIWIVPAFLLARISGMSFNQLIDRHIDARNPRTQNRALPSGRVTVLQARIVAWGALVLFIVVCFQMNAFAASLAPVAAFLLYIYSYMKRIHYTCHLVLGCIHFLGPTMAYAAITGSPSIPSLFLGGAACLSIMGTDIIYAIQDHAFDCSHRLFSIPSRLGGEASLAFAACLHVFCLLMLLGVGLSAHLPLFYYLLLPVAGALFMYFHTLWRKHKQSLIKVAPSFFYCNVAISCTSFFFLAVSHLPLGL
jgi:4-hydroxybenzoate polyprenyltransferase